jgi:hypothetical protein
MTGFDFAKMDIERSIAERLVQHRVDIFIGHTDPSSRKEAFRDAIKKCGLDCVIFGTNASGKTETYAQIFQRVYGEKL